MFASDVAFEIGSSWVNVFLDVSHDTPKATVVQPGLSLPLPIGAVPGGDPVDHLEYIVHLAPERRAPSVEVGPRMPKIAAELGLGVGVRVSDPRDVAEDGQVAIVGEHVIVGRDAGESGLGPERVVRRQDPRLMLRRQKLCARSRAIWRTASMNSTLPRRSGGFRVRQTTTHASIGEL